MAARRERLKTLPGGSVVDEGIRRLWVAALEGARDDLRLGETTRPTESYDRPNFQRERDWFHAETRAVGSFLWVCDLLKFAPSYWRRGLLTPQRPSVFQVAQLRRQARNRQRRSRRKVG